MASTNVLQQLEDGHSARPSWFLGLKLLLAEYRRAVAADEFYEQLRCASGGLVPKVPRSEIARAVFTELYAGGEDRLQRPR